MLDLYNLPKTTDVQTFIGNMQTNATSMQKWHKPRGKNMTYMFLLGEGGNGGAGAIGAAGSAGGGGGGASGVQGQLLIPTYLLPDTLDIYLGAGGTGSISYISYPNILASASIYMACSPGGNGTAGASGAPAAAIPIASMRLAGTGIWKSIGANGGAAGGVNTAGNNLTLPVTGIVVTGGTGGAGVPVSGAGLNGGSYISPPPIFPAHAGGVGGSGTTTPPSNGTNGYQANQGLFFQYGGTGGGSTHSTATGAGLVQSSGGSGAFGCGGGGSGGALTGSTAGKAGRGGPGFCMIISW